MSPIRGTVAAASNRGWGTAPWSPVRLFQQGENGFWYDASDLTPEKLAWVAANPGFTSAQFLAAFPTHALYQNSTGTTPVTALGQPVGLVIDKSRGGLAALGSELVTNGDFATDSNWTKGTNWSISSGVASNSGGLSNSSLTQSGITQLGKWYKATITVVSLSGGNASATGSGIQNIATLTTGVNTFYFTPTDSSGTFGVRTANSGTVVTVDNISVREVPGVHASQSTDASRPTLQARVNLLTYSEQFENAAWTKNNASIAANTTDTTDPLGGNTADKYTNTGATDYLNPATGLSITATATYTVSMYAKKGSQDWLRVSAFAISSGSGRFTGWFNLATGAKGTTTADTANGASVAGSTIESLGNGWYRCSVTGKMGTSDTQMWPAFMMVDGDGSITRPATNNTIYFWGSQLELGSLTTYQRVTTATDYADVGAPRGFDFDAVDDALVTASQSWATTKLSSFAGAFADTGGEGNFGRFYQRETGLRHFNISNSATEIRGIGGSFAYSTTSLTAAAANNSIPAFPTSVVVSQVWNGGPNYTDVTLRDRGVTLGYNTTVSTNSSGTLTSDANTAFTIGNRAAGDRTFDGRINQLIFRDTDTDLGTIQQVERFIAQKSGVAI